NDEAPCNTRVSFRQLAFKQKGSLWRRRHRRRHEEARLAAAQACGTMQFYGVDELRSSATCDVSRIARRQRCARGFAGRDRNLLSSQVILRSTPGPPSVWRYATVRGTLNKQGGGDKNCGGPPWLKP